MTLTFSFNTAKLAGVSGAQAFAKIELTKVQLDNFSKLRDLSKASKTESVELFVRGVTWQAPVPPLESDVIMISDSRGICLRASTLKPAGTVLHSDWIDWGTLDLHAIMMSEMDVHDVLAV